MTVGGNGNKGVCSITRRNNKCRKPAGRTTRHQEEADLPKEQRQLVPSPSSSS